ncbi:hypothetical protein GJV06_19190 [Enterobacteriaceae bacterium RIT691]|nr:hypothetical protein [Enterobacteriaceae bacterium RIT691]
MSCPLAADLGKCGIIANPVVSGVIETDILASSEDILIGLAGQDSNGDNSAFNV